MSIQKEAKEMNITKLISYTKLLDDLYDNGGVNHSTVPRVRDSMGDENKMRALAGEIQEKISMYSNKLQCQGIDSSFVTYYARNNARDNQPYLFTGGNPSVPNPTRFGGVAHVDMLCNKSTRDFIRFIGK